MFKESFKYYKSKHPSPNLDSVITFQNADSFTRLELKQGQDEIWENDLAQLGLTNPNQWHLFELNAHPGLLVLKSLFTWQGQRYWIRKCLSEFTCPPNKCNLHAHGDLKPDEDWWAICNSDLTRKSKIYKQLRWITLGYHHNWDTKVYSEDSKSPFPSDLESLSSVISCAVGSKINAQAAIINFYHMDSTLSGHTDHSEPNSTAPLLSFSFGQSAIFLIGGAGLDDPTSALLLDSGDVVIMSGESRQAYHGVPKILPYSTLGKTLYNPWDPPSLDQYANDSHADWSPFAEYVNFSRINMNVRQVLFSFQNEL